MTDPAAASPDPPVYDLEALVEAQEAFFRSGATRPVEFRRERLRALAAEIERRADDFLEALGADLGKPPLEAYLSEVHFTLAEIRLFVKRLPRWARPRRVRNPFYFFPARSEIRREPYGKALVAAPWNYPAQLCLSPLASAVAAGNCVVLKPSELAPATGALLAETLSEVFDPGHAAAARGGPETGRRLLELPFDVWFYTGGARVGKLYSEAAARRPAPCILELGGKSPCVIDSRVDLQRAVERIVAAKFFNAGQTCIAPDFVLAPEALADEFARLAAAELEAAYGAGPPADLARIVNERHFDRLAALDFPGSLRVGVDDRDRLHFAPRILPQADWGDPAMQEEIFGPLLPVLPYRDLEEALNRLAAMPTPLALYAFSRDRATLERIAAAVPSGSVAFNDALKQAAHLGLPFGGAGASGHGRYRGRAGFESFSYPRPVLRRPLGRDWFLVKPPYGDRLDKLRKLLK